MIWVVYSGWQTSTAECVFVEAPTEDEAKELAFVIFCKAAAPGHGFTLEAEPLRLNEITGCEGWASR